jgi:hypothetical protein
MNRRMPTLAKVATFWRSEYVDFGEPGCLRCEWLCPELEADEPWRHVSRWLDRAHLKDRRLGGEDVVQNLVPLCILCHDEMPSFADSGSALAWVRAGRQRGWGWQVLTDARVDADPDRTLTRAGIRRMWLRYLEEAMPMVMRP